MIIFEDKYLLLWGKNDMRELTVAEGGAGSTLGRRELIYKIAIKICKNVIKLIYFCHFIN